MKLTKLHIFIIILIALILCPTLGACSIEGYVNRYPTNSSSSSTNEMVNTADSNGQQPMQYSKQFSSYQKLDSALDRTTMNNNPNYVSSYNTGYSSSSSGNNKGLVAWFKNLF